MLTSSNFSVTFSLLVLYLSSPTWAWSNARCLDQLRRGELGDFGLNSSGQHVPFQNATTMPYEVCLRCEDGHGQEAFNWSVFSKQFSSWLLPWLALISQLPFGAKYRQDNITAMVLTIGSPVLAAYSLILTVLNGYHVARRFSGMTYPNAYYAARIMAGLQQSPLHLSTEDGLLASLIVLPQNDRWWPLMYKLINYEHTWSIAAFASIAWVVIAYILTVVDSFADVTEAINSNGQAVGSLWLWLLPIVIGWLQISPKCDADRLQSALSDANEEAFVALHDACILPARTSESRVGSRRAFMFLKRELLASPDQACTSPIFNYARALPWARNVEILAAAFHYASEHAESKIPVNQGSVWAASDEKLDPENRMGTSDQIEAYCRPTTPWRIMKDETQSHVVSRMAVASMIALVLQWSTVGGAVIVVWFTPTSGLGCRSGSYFLYAINSTVIWALMLISSVLSHTSSEKKHLFYAKRRSQRAASFATLLRRLGKGGAVLNTIWIIVACIFQFSNVFDRCYCNSSVLGRGAGAYNVMKLLPHDTPSIIHAWIGGVALALISSFAFIGFVQIYLNPPLLPER